MLPAARMQFIGYAIWTSNKNSVSANDLADLGYGHSRDLVWEAFSWRDGEQQFIVFPAMQSEVEVHFAGRLPDAGARDQGGVQFRAYSAFFANMGQVGGKAVAGVDHRRGESFLPQDAAEFEPGFGVEMATIVTGAKLFLRTHHAHEGCRGPA